MTTYKRRKEKLIDELKDKEYRDAFVAEQINVGIPFQIKEIRNQRKWSQTELGKKVHEIMKQEQISRLEDPNYASFTLSTLKKLASAFEVGLMVRFVPISDLVEWELGLTSESLEAVSYNEDAYFENKPDESTVDDNQFVENRISDRADRRKTHKVDLPIPDAKVMLFSSIINNQASMPSNTLGLVSAQS
jgi:transcriptional regulator with XRE-family HTH domain|tara:strand:+ start:1580 stop:2149 length:570 start_codon:yes stop_codon:yes gene_type:complete